MVFPTLAPAVQFDYAEGEVRMKTSEAEQHGYRCPKCRAVLTSDRKGRGFVRHTANDRCRYRNGERCPLPCCGEHAT